MAHPEEPQSPGDDREEEGPGSPWLPPDDRLWRHPSEVRGNAATGPVGRPGGVAGWARVAPARTWLVGTVSGFIGALAAAIVLVATGAVGTPTAVIAPPPRTTPSSGDPPTTGAPPNLIGMLGMVSPSVVGITVNGPSGVQVGSGVLVGNTIGDESYIVTDYYPFSVAGSGAQVQVTTDWGQTVNGSLVGTDPESGIALVKAPLTPVAKATADGANVSSVANIQTGEAIFAVGSRPMAASMNVSNFAPGYIDDTLSYLAPNNGASSAMFSMLVANISVAAPDFGGAVVDASGNLLGLTNQVPGTQDGLTYVVPIDTVMAEVSPIMKDGQAGPYPWLGVLQATDLTNPDGIQVESVGSGSPVARAGVADNDVITTLDGRSVATVGELIEWLSNARPGQVMSISWLDDDHRHSAVVTLGNQPASAVQS